jgi:PEP-CTERM motif
LRIARVLLGLSLLVFLTICAHADGIPDPSMQFEDPSCGVEGDGIPCTPVVGTTFTFTTTTGQGIFGFTNNNPELTFTSIFVQEIGIPSAAISCDTGANSTDPNTGGTYLFDRCQTFDSNAGFTGIYFSAAPQVIFGEALLAESVDGTVQPPNAIRPGDEFFFSLNPCPNCVDPNDPTGANRNGIWLVPQTFYVTANLTFSQAFAASSPVTAPEPGSLTLLGIGALGALACRLRKRR